MRHPPDAYFAGLIDGEGWVSIVPRYGTPYFNCIIDVGLAHKPTIDLLFDRFGGAVRLRKSKKENHSDIWHWRVRGRGTRPVLLAIRPYAVIKKDEVESCVRFLKEDGKW